VRSVHESTEKGDLRQKRVRRHASEVEKLETNRNNDMIKFHLLFALIN